MSDDIKQFREAVYKFDELKIELEILKDALEKNFNDYKNVSDISSDIADKNQVVLESINTLQIQATDTVENAVKKATDLKEEMSKYYSAEYTKTKKDLDALLASMDNKLQTLQATTEKTIQSAVNNISIDTSSIEKAVNEKLNSFDTQRIDALTNKINEYLDTEEKRILTRTEDINSLQKEYRQKFEELEKELEKQYELKKEWTEKNKEINKKIQKSFKSVKGLILTVLISILLGMALGTIATNYFTVNTLTTEKKIQNKKPTRTKENTQEIRTKTPTQSTKTQEQQKDMLSSAIDFAKDNPLLALFLLSIPFLLFLFF